MRRRRKSTNNRFETKPSDYIDVELVDKASLWILRTLLLLGAHREFIDKDAYINKDVTSVSCTNCSNMATS